MGRTTNPPTFVGGQKVTIVRRDPNISAPEFPLPDPSDRELAYWSELWDLPQASQWVKRGLDRAVAEHVRTAIAIESGGATPPMLAAVRSQRADLGISLPGQRALGWEVEYDSGELTGAWWDK